MLKFKLTVDYMDLITVMTGMSLRSEFQVLNWLFSYLFPTRLQIHHYIQISAKLFRTEINLLNKIVARIHYQFKFKSCQIVLYKR